MPSGDDRWTTSRASRLHMGLRRENKVTHGGAIRDGIPPTPKNDRWTPCPAETGIVRGRPRVGALFPRDGAVAGRPPRIKPEDGGRLDIGPEKMSEGPHAQRSVPVIRDASVRGDMTSPSRRLGDAAKLPYVFTMSKTGRPEIAMSRGNMNKIGTFIRKSTTLLGGTRRTGENAAPRRRPVSARGG